MPMMDMPPMQVAQVVIERRVGEAGIRGLPPNSSTTQKNDAYQTLGVCHLHPTAGQMKPEYYDVAYRALNPRLNADAFFFSDPIQRADLALDEAQVEVVRLPEHGKLGAPRTVRGVEQLFSYYPDNGFVGNDRVEFLLTNGDGLRVKVVYFIKVDQKYDSYLYPKVDMYPRYCPKPATSVIGLRPPLSNSSSRAGTT